MQTYDNFMSKYAAYEAKHGMEKVALIELLLPHITQHLPAVAQHLPPDAAIGLAATGAKMVATKALTKAVTGINEARKLKRRFGMGLYEAYKLRNTPAANLALGRGLPAPKPGKLEKAYNVAAKTYDVGSVGYNAAMLGKYLL